MKLYSVAKKIYHIICAQFLNKNNFIYPNLYLFNQNRHGLAKAKTVLFYFDSTEYMHLGDHLFFMPLVKVFIDSGYDVEVRTTIVMYDIFKALNLNVVEFNKPFEEYDIIISRFELINRLKKYRSLLVHVSKNITKPISEHIIYECSKYFNLKNYTKPNLSVFYNRDIFSKFNLPVNKKLVFFSLYCDASSYLLTEAKKSWLLHFIEQYTNDPEYLVVLIGSKFDKLSDKRNYNFKHIDLRGLTSVMDIFSIVGADNTLYYIGFDAFLMHVFSLFEKHSFVVFRGRITKKQNDMLKKYHIKLFNQDKYVTLLN